MKKNICYLFTFLVLLIPNLTFAKNWNIGAVFGSPTGLSATYFYKADRVLHSTLAYSLGNKNDLQFSSHYEWRKKNQNLNWFYGVGGKVQLTDFNAGPSASLGIFHDFKETPVEIFLKTALTLNIISKTSSDLNLMLGIHYQI
jgi:hypothetical protein